MRFYKLESYLFYNTYCGGLNKKALPHVLKILLHKFQLVELFGRD